MSNGIYSRQNENSNITRLAAQRQLYQDVNHIEMMNVFLSVIIPLILSMIQDICVEVKAFACIYTLIILYFSLKLDDRQKEKKKLAATIQQEFEINVFSMEWDKKLFGMRKDLNSEIVRASKKILNNENEKSKLENWFAKEYDALPIQEGIAACQRESFRWDKRLRKRYRTLLLVILFFVFSSQFMIGWMKAEHIYEILLRFSALPAFSQWITKTIIGIGHDLDRMQTMEPLVYSTERKTMEELAFIQKEIFENRKIQTKIPDWFYKIFRNKDQEHERKASEIH